MDLFGYCRPVRLPLQTFHVRRVETILRCHPNTVSAFTMTMADRVRPHLRRPSRKTDLLWYSRPLDRALKNTELESKREDLNLQHSTRPKLAQIDEIKAHRTSTGVSRDSETRAPL